LSDTNKLMRYNLGKSHHFFVIDKVGIDSLDTLPVKLLMMQFKLEDNRCNSLIIYF
jgi:hypothetical protein